MVSKNFRFNEQVIIGQVQKGQEFQKAGDFVKAEAVYLTVLSQNPSELNSLFSLATLYQQMGKLPIAINLFRRLLMLAPPNPAIYNNLGGCLHQESDNEGALEAYSLANKLSKGQDPDILSNLGGLAVNDNRPEFGLPYLDKAVELKPDHPHANWNRSLVYLELERWAEGFDGYEYGMSTGDRKNKTYGNVPKWNGEDCNTIVVCGEQGIGDEVMFSSCLVDLAKKVKRIVFDCHPRLVEAFAHHEASKLCDFIVTPTRKKAEVEWLDEYKPDYCVNVGSLGKFFRRNKENFPGQKFLTYPTDALDKWKKILDTIDNKPKIGISWFGGAKKTRSDIRSIPLENLIPITTIDKYTFINLQYNVKEHDLNEVEKQSGVKLHYVTSEDDYFSWLGVLNACDYVISVCTSIVHLAGAYGIPCICMVPSKPAWRYGLKKDKMVWYDSVKLVRQTEDDEWKDVVNITKDILLGEV